MNTQHRLVPEEYGQSATKYPIIGGFFMRKNIYNPNEGLDVRIYEEKVGNLIFQNVRKVQGEQELRTVVNQKISNLIKKDLSKGAAIC